MKTISVVCFAVAIIFFALYISNKNDSLHYFIGLRKNPNWVCIDWKNETTVAFEKLELYPDETLIGNYSNQTISLIGNCVSSIKNNITNVWEIVCGCPKERNEVCAKVNITEYGTKQTCITEGLNCSNKTICEKTRNIS